MRAYHLEQLGEVDHIAVREDADPTSGPHAVLVRIRAAPLNHRDLMILSGTYRSVTARFHPLE